MAPKTKIIIRDGGLGIAGPGADGIHVKLGVSAKAKVSKLYSANDPTVLRDAIGDGPLLEAAAASLRMSGGPVYCMGITPATFGAPGAVSKAGAGTAVLGVTAKPFTQVKVKATTTGALGTAKVRVSLDGGATWGDEVTSPVTATPWTIPDAPGIKLTLTTGGGTDLTLGDVHTIDTDGTVTKAGTGTATTVLTSASVVDAYDVTVEVLVAAANLAAGAAQIRYTVDGKDTYSPPVAIPVSGKVVIPDTGLLLTFVDGTFVVGDVFAFTATGPSYSTTELNTALDAVSADPTVFEFLHIVGQAASGATAATLAVAVQAKLDGMAAAFRYAWAITEAGTDTDANLKTAFLATVATRVVVVPNDVETISQISGRILRRSAAQLVAARAAGVPVSEDLGRVASGGLSGVVSLYRDERATPGLDDQRFTTLTTILGYPGFFVTQGLTMAAATSDFSLLANRRVMDKACRIGRAALVLYMNESIRVNPTTGKILEKEALQIEGAIEAKLAAQMGPGRAGGDCSGIAVYVDRDENILSTKKLPVKIRLVPLGYAKEIEGDIGFTNPRMSVA